MNGRDVLKLPNNGVRHRSEMLENFILESSSQTDRLSCTIRYEFNYDDGSTDGMTERREVSVVYPDRGHVSALFNLIIMVIF